MKKTLATVSMMGALVLAIPAWAGQMSGNQAHQPAAAKASPHHEVHKAKRSEQVRRLQAALNRHGAKLKVDGLMGGHTRMAVRNFQKANGIKPSGRLDKETASKLGV